jgi:CheY-like chemotaxis protein
MYKIYNFVEQHNEIDCFLLDLRLHEDDFSLSKDLTGHLVSRKIKELNKGNQIIVFTASNKIWNLKEEINKIGASAYILKESPDLNYNELDSLNLYKEFVSSLKQACYLSYLKNIYTKLSQIKCYLYAINSFEEKTNEIITNIDIAFDLLMQSHEKSEYKTYAYLQLFLIIEEDCGIINVRFLKYKTTFLI